MNFGDCLRAAGRNLYYHRAIIDSNTEECGAVLDDILGVAKAFDYGDRHLFAIQLACEEALVNAIKHGNRFQPTCKVTILYTITNSQVRIRISDQGDGFDPQNVRDPTASENLCLPSGRGLMLMREWMTGVRFNEQGNSVEMWKLKDDCEDQ